MFGKWNWSSWHVPQHHVGHLPLCRVIWLFHFSIPVYQTKNIYILHVTSIGSELAATQKDLSSTPDSSSQGGSPVLLSKTAHLPQTIYKTCTFSLLLTNAHTEVTSDEIRSTTWLQYYWYHAPLTLTPFVFALKIINRLHNYQIFALRNIFLTCLDEVT